MDFTFLASTEFFADVKPEEIRERLACLGANVRSYPKGTCIHHAGDRVSTVSLVTKGSVIIEHNDIWGNRTILGQAMAGDLFAEAYACLGSEPLMISVTASEETTVLMMNLQKVLTTCSKSCPQHQKIAENLLKILARKNLSLSRRMLHTAPKTIRGRVLSYLSFLSTRSHSSHVTVPFDRQQLADYLGVDRSGLSAELSKMQKDGLIRYHRNEFFLSANDPS